MRWATTAAEVEHVGDDKQLRISAVRSGAAGGSTGQWMLITNVGATPCTITGLRSPVVGARSF
jgi:hypothetical protein